MIDEYDEIDTSVKFFANRFLIIAKLMTINQFETKFQEAINLDVFKLKSPRYLMLFRYLITFKIVVKKCLGFDFLIILKFTEQSVQHSVCSYLSVLDNF